MHLTISTRQKTNKLEDALCGFWCGSRMMPHYKVEPRFNEVRRDWGNWFVISRVHYIEVLLHTLHYYWAEKYRLLYRGLCYNYRGSLNQGYTVQVVEVQNTPTASPTTSFFAGSPIIALAPCQTLQPTALLYKRAVLTQGLTPGTHRSKSLHG